MRLIVVVAVRPAVIATVGDAHEFFVGKIRRLIVVEELRPIVGQHVASLLNAVELAVRRIDVERDEIAIARRVVMSIGLRLVRSCRIERPHAGADRQFGTWVLPRRLELPIRRLT